MDSKAVLSTSNFSLLSLGALTAAIAVWMWLLSDTAPHEIAIFSGVALAAGTAGHLVYSLWLPWRGTVIVTVLLIYNGCLLGIMVLETGIGARLQDYVRVLGEVLAQPALMISGAASMREHLFALAILLATAIFSPAHAVRPGFPTAIISAIGIGIWYAVALLILMHAA